MVKVIQKTKILCAVAAATILPFATALSAHAADTTITCSTPSSTPCTSDLTFQVGVNEMLSVNISAPSTWASGDTGEFLRNRVNLTVTSNNANGFTASMSTSDTGTALVNTSSSSSDEIPSLTSSVAASTFKNNGTSVNKWGFSLNDTTAGSDSATYQQVVGTDGTPSTILKATAPAVDSSQDIYFGASINQEKDAGTYEKAVVINVVAGVISGTNPVTPTNPDTPNDTPNNNTTIADYDNTNKTTTYTRRTTSGTGTSSVDGATSSTLSEIYSGDTTSSYAGPQGVRTTSSIGEGTPLATGLAVTAGIAAASGLVFFIIAKRRNDDDDEEEVQ